MFLGFWKEAYAKFFEGSNLLVPMVNPHIDMTAYIYPIFGRIISHGYLVAGILAHSNHFAYLNLYVIWFGITSRETFIGCFPGVYQ